MASTKTGVIVQNQLFDLIKKQIPANYSLVDSIAELLEISNDSAYRRLRGETLVDIHELLLLCSHFKISLDKLSSNSSNLVSFNYQPLSNNQHTLLEYLQNILGDMKKINAVENKQIVFTSEDIPIFHYFKYDILTAFKLFYWDKSILNANTYEGKKFNPNLVQPEAIQAAKEIFDLYIKIPSIEIWTEDTIVSVLKQIEFYWESGLFENKEDALAVINQLQGMVTTIQQDAELSSKLRNNVATTTPNYTLFWSEVTIGNNCIQVTINDVQMIYFSFNTFNSMSTTHTSFCNETDTWIKNLIKKSVQISGVSEKQRYQFFMKVNNYINVLKKKIVG